MTPTLYYTPSFYSETKAALFCDDEYVSDNEEDNVSVTSVSVTKENQLQITSMYFESNQSDASMRSTASHEKKEESDHYTKGVF
eukprot:UN10951